ncbi:helix-turn-helix domain-containing protein [Microvirga aerophila]|uniref:Helix-turn-helix domain-containing protein n=1 Tax=Microvirga aerophila TaxID=670291 RepID=A0A512C4I0_9HYPH|nr:helix-turn-helix domain-containing protein [Microvirga aerophila]GEO19080.1 hypothetical protein MAE02_67760 [Microvirga aerophila]
MTRDNRTLVRLDARLALSIEEIGAPLGLSRWTIEEEISSGRLQGRKVGRRTVVLRADLEAYLDRSPKTGVVRG